MCVPFALALLQGTLTDTQSPSRTACTETAALRHARLVLSWPFEIEGFEGLCTLTHNAPRARTTIGAEPVALSTLACFLFELVAYLASRFVCFPLSCRSVSDQDC